MVNTCVFNSRGRNDFLGTVHENHSEDLLPSYGGDDHRHINGRLEGHNVLMLEGMVGSLCII